MKLEGRTALVTGAGHRLGRAIALALGEAGCHVGVHYHHSQRSARETVASLERCGVRASAHAADLREPAEIESLADSVESALGSIDILVNSAAGFRSMPASETDAAAWDDVQNLNLRAPFLLTRALLAGLSTRGPDAPGCVVNVADASAVRPWKGFAAHGTSKAGLVYLTRSLARELGPAVRVNAVIPGPILPPPAEEPDSATWAGRGKRLPLQRTGRADEVGHAVRFLCENDFITGAIVPVDGGETLVTGRGSA